MHKDMCFKAVVIVTGRFQGRKDVNKVIVYRNINLLEQGNINGRNYITALQGSA
jgi:hypothetical protein